MAVVENAAASPEALARWRASMRSMDHAELMAQQLVQRGAEHALAELQKIGATPENCAAMLTRIREALFEVHAVATERGIPLVDYSAPKTAGAPHKEASTGPGAEPMLTAEDWQRLESLRVIVDGGPDCQIGIHATLLWRLIETADALNAMQSSRRHGGSGAGEELDYSHLWCEVRYEREMLASVLRAVLKDPRDQEAISLAKTALGQVSGVEQ
jgi:hypothetical protein